jgi:hypothetical protein
MIFKFGGGKIRRSKGVSYLYGVPKEYQDMTLRQSWSLGLRTSRSECNKVRLRIYLFICGIFVQAQAPELCSDLEVLNSNE